LTFAPPKTDAGKRNVVIPPMILAEVRDHMSSHVAPETDALMFARPTGTAVRHSNFHRRVRLPALAAS
jgi:hypothetical protein